MEFWRVARGQGPIDKILVAIWDPLPLFFPIFTTVMHFNGIALFYYYSPGGSTSLGGGMCSVECSVVIFLSVNISNALHILVLGK